MHETLPRPHQFCFHSVWVEKFKWWYIYYSGLFPWRRPHPPPPPFPFPPHSCKMLDLIMVVAVKADLEGCPGNMQKKKKSFLDENVQEVNGSVGLCDDGVDVSAGGILL